MTTNAGIPVTTLARTLLDLTDVVPRQALKRAINESEYLQPLDMTALRAVVDRNPGRRGATLLKAADEPPNLTRSDLEDRLLALCARHDLPMPLTNQVVCGHEVDAHWPSTKLVVELDGYAAHTTRRAFQNDRERDRLLVRAGYRPVRVTDRDLRDETALAGELRELLRS